jgi:cobalt-zinc-cadmium efflux system protein
LARTNIEDLNIKSALLHEIGDMASSVAIVIGGIIIYYNKNYILDPILSFFICLLIIIWAIRLIVESANILLESTPKHIDIDEIIKIVSSQINGVYEMHHVHVWTITSSIYALTAHVVIDDCQLSKANEILDKINALVKEKFRIGHTNIQFECIVKNTK